MRKKKSLINWLVGYFRFNGAKSIKRHAAPKQRVKIQKREREQGQNIWMGDPIQI